MSEDLAAMSSRERITTSFHQRRTTSCFESTKSLGIRTRLLNHANNYESVEEPAQTREEHVMLDWMLLVVVFAGLTTANIVR